MANVVVAGVRDLVEQLAGHEQKTRCAVAALKGAALDERLLFRAQGIAVGKAFDGGHLRAINEGGEVQAAGHRQAVDEHGAAAAQALLAAGARTEQTELFLQQFDYGVMRLDLRVDTAHIQVEAD